MPRKSKRLFIGVIDESLSEPILHPTAKQVMQ